MSLPPNMAWGSKRVHQQQGTLPCGEPRCPIGMCGGFPCQHAPPCGNINCTAQLLAMGFPPGGAPRPIGINMCPTDRFTNVTAEEIAAAMPKDGADAKASGKKSKAGKKGKK